VRLADFDYPLDTERIAQRPLARREDSRLLVVRRDGLEHARFADLPGKLAPGTVLVLNDSAVIPARLLGRKVTGGEVELLCVRELAPTRWTCLARSSKPLRPGAEVLVDGVSVKVVGRGDDLVEIEAGEPVASLLARAGQVPLPPYIRRAEEPADRERYQTVYARAPGSVAAPTAGLHFTEALLSDLARADVEVRFLTLHVGPGTFLPVRGAVEEHRLIAEPYAIPDETTSAVMRARAEGRAVVAVGTTAVRALEHWAATGRRVGEADLLILPGHEFRAVTGMVTNFHHPRTTLLMLVAALGGRQRILHAYAEALRAGYRLLSYGDAMLVR
jgi:S-adenosylmethionine:tRNA ribosyltransferase-isomerase